MKPNGGSAFPVANAVNANGDQILWPETGMSLRDYFAAKAMIAIVSGCDWPTVFSNVVAKASYEFADAMLQEREK